MVRSAEYFDLGSDGALVVIEALEGKLEPVILVAAFVAQQDGRAVVLRDEEIGSAISIKVSGDEGARIGELDLVEADFDGDVFPSVGSEIAEEADFAFAIFG